MTHSEHLQAAKEAVNATDTVYNNWEEMRNKMTENPSEMTIDVLLARLERASILALTNQAEELRKPKENSAHGYTEGADVPEPTIATDSTKTLTTCNGRIIHGICEKCYNNAQTSSAYCTRLIEVEPQEPTRKLVTEELIEWLRNERLDNTVRNYGKTYNFLIDKVLGQIQSLKAKEIDNIKDGFIIGQKSIIHKEQSPASTYITQTYQPKP